jgi:hypothetical protein
MMPLRFTMIFMLFCKRTTRIGTDFFYFIMTLGKNSSLVSSKKLQDSTVASNCFPKYFCSIQVSLQDIYFLFFEFCSTANQLPSDYDSEMCVFSNCKWVMYYCKFAEYLNVVQILQFLIV